MESLFLSYVHSVAIRKTRLVRFEVFLSVVRILGLYTRLRCKFMNIIIFGGELSEFTVVHLSKNYWEVKNG